MERRVQDILLAHTGTVRHTYETVVVMEEQQLLNKKSEEWICPLQGPNY